ncbi:MAG: ricin-type beta-trefoil lectin domain protein [Streptomyces sp.]|nr:ricin-type beta-trefoil lectin domain protein [Streptomyces sp.]
MSSRRACSYVVGPQRAAAAPPRADPPRPGHSVYGVYVQPGAGYRHAVGSGVATDGGGAAVQMWDCQSGAGDQHWTHESDGSLTTLGRCLDVTGDSTAEDTPVELWDCDGNGGQVWVQQTDGSLVNPQSGLCLDATGGATANATRLQIHDCNGTAAQKFALH